MKKKEDLYQTPYLWNVFLNNEMKYWGYTQKELAEKMGINQSSLHGLRTSRRGSNISSMTTILKVLHAFEYLECETLHDNRKKFRWNIKREHQATIYGGKWPGLTRKEMLSLSGSLSKFIKRERDSIKFVTLARMCVIRGIDPLELLPVKEEYVEELRDKLKKSAWECQQMNKGLKD